MVLSILLFIKILLAWTVLRRRITVSFGFINDLKDTTTSWSLILSSSHDINREYILLNKINGNPLVLVAFVAPNRNEN